MKIPDSLEARVRAMIAEIGYRKAGWFCKVGEKSVRRWMNDEVEPHEGSLLLLERGVGVWERARGVRSTDHSGALSERN